MGPQLERTIKEQLDYEHQVMEGKAERKPVSKLLQREKSTLSLLCVCVTVQCLRHVLYLHKE